ncbi:hypothetical protein M9Y10_018785 [Tritrichomonas musculus]|uniref:DUF3447 domain-containing protein n=1 Tax=Tritrichomonas musculus TaxID=1915356 RepID=A0ABR2HHS9_9EUKA
MSVQEYLENFGEIQSAFLNYIDENNDSENFQNLKNIFDDLTNRHNPHELKSLLNLISNISNHHRRASHFFDKIEQILLILKDEIKKDFSNSEIFNIFKGNKRILLFLIKEQIIAITKSIEFDIQNTKFKNAFYQEYFSTEIYSPFEKDLPENFEEKRKNGENEGSIYEFIRNDSINEFIIHVNKTIFPLTKKIETSMFETNSFLIKNKPTLIEYAAFFGSIQIFKYLLLNKIELTPSLWLFAIHGNNPEMIHLLEERHVIPKSYKECLKEAIKCHHNEIASYIHDYLLPDDEDNSLFVLRKSLESYNFSFIEIELINESIFYELCKYDYYTLVDILLKTNVVDINKICPDTIFIFNCLNGIFFLMILIKQLFMLLLKKVIWTLLIF